MQLKPLPQYFIIKIEIEKQKQRKEKIGSLYLHCNEIFMQRNIQSGEIIGIGTIAAKQFPQAKIGDVLIVHHFVESEINIIYCDEIYNYYNVTALDFNGRRNETYAAYSNSKIIPHPEFIFIEPEKKAEEISPEEFIEKNTKQVGSLILFNNWEEKREDKELQARTIVDEIKNQSKGKHLNDDVKSALNAKQMEAEKITKSLNKKQYKLYKVAASNPAMKAKENVFALNQAAMTELEFMDKNYFVVNSKYVVATA